MYLLVFLLWILLVAGVIRMIFRAVQRTWLKLVVCLMFAPALTVLPIIDELIAKPAYDRLCKQAQEVTVLEAIPVREPFYDNDGRWRLASIALSSAETKRISEAYDALVQHESRGPIRVSTVVPVDKYEVRVTSRTSGRLLASYQKYATSGGWVSRMLEVPILLRAQCLPQVHGQALQQRILPFSAVVRN